ncbi:hypothetical protein PS862_03893 [Pseudomonas fluorescens]|uniref:Uncharacterized protein n=1 Tax=Pseudomonas fluorescens TaxID=294 RepID=A0A5E7MAR2_PSEFL|nr:hypothetical protein [Pseudomonas fluorescens]VVM60780.1 hypothetical protein PS639_01266 [Pseudomonas fluorescens]VVP21762.1 hypothetical protein PS862_03893 [Pseudomonas fluorescens]
MTKMGAIFLLLVAGTAHSAERLTSVQVSGLFVPGSQALGQAQGFTECIDFQNYLSCTRSKPMVVFGATASSAEITLDVTDNFSSEADPMGSPKIMGVAPERLTYRSIRLEFQPQEREALEKALRADGWFAIGNDKRLEFYKVGIPATFRIGGAYTTLSPVDINEVSKRASRLEAKANHSSASSGIPDPARAMLRDTEPRGAGSTSPPRF